MNKRGNIMLSLIFFLMGLGVLVVFISPLSDFINLMQQSDSLNCKGYLHNGLNETSSSLAFNSTLHGGESGSPLACLSLKLYLPYLLLIFLIGGISAVLGGRGLDWFGMSPNNDQYY